MGKDYYAILGISRNATDTDIKKAYRKLSLKYHPEKNKSPGSSHKFNELAEAYDVLSNPDLKACYDKFDEEGLKGGVPTSDGNCLEGYVFRGNSEQIFSEFFGTNNPFADLFNYDAGTDSDGFATFGGLKGRAQPKQDPPIERDLVLTLEEAFNGAVKKMKISRKVLNDDGRTTSTREKILTIKARPGWKQGTRITFPKEGDQGPNRIPADIVFILKDKPHPQFERKENDLIYKPVISLVTALTGGTIEMRTLDGRVIRIPINEIISPGHEKRVVGEGMPFLEEPTKRGDLIVRFQLKFPSTLDKRQKLLLKQALVEKDS